MERSSPCGALDLDGSAVCGLGFLATLGHGAAELAFTLLVAGHALSVTHRFQSRLAPQVRAAQVILTVMLFFSINQWVYRPARGWFYQHVALPLRTTAGVVVVNPNTRPDRVQRGDWIACRTEGHSQGELVLQAGFVCGPVLAVGGDTVSFEPGVYRVNGVAHPALPHMPAEGARQVPENHWFIWPELHTVSYTAPESTLSQVAQQLALPERGDFAGKAFRHWFFRRQVRNEPIRQSGV